jgi:GTP-binding protein HflX
VTDSVIGDDGTSTRAWVLHPDITSERIRRAAEPALAEAVALAAAMPDLEVLGSTSVRLPKIHPGHLFGTGKIEELGKIFKEAKIQLVLIDGTVSPVQQRNLEKSWQVKILDRTGLILEIFSDRARTSEGVLQVEMAALSYQRTRLVRAWTHLERQRGGLGFVGGPGETQIESDRRAIDEQLTRLKRQMAKVVKTRTLHRDARKKIPYPIVALVGYTNAGKSTLFNRLTGAEVFVKDMLFATLDPTMRSVVLPSGREIIMSDTVGFISDLPTQLVAAFRATLEEVLEADLILHVRDISHHETTEQARDVMAILTDLGVSKDVPLFEVWNKMDLLEPEDAEPLQVTADRREDVFAISALTGAGLDEMLESISGVLTPQKFEHSFSLSFAQGKQRAWLHQQDVVEAETQTDTGFDLTVLWTARQEKQFRDL